MNNLKLTRQKKPNFDELYEMKSALMDFLEEKADCNNTEWMENLNEILDFQDTDDSFKLLSTYEIPSDARVDFCHEPTYICSAILMKAYLTGDSALREKVETPLVQGLEMCTMRNLSGHGYESLQGKIEALKIFMKGGLREYMDLHSESDPLLFTEMILNIMVEFDAREEQEVFKDHWGEDYKEDILKINEYFSTRAVFVYGTLMTGENNHYLLENSRFLKASSIEGYEMYNAGWFPAIIPGKGIIPGELYEVHENDIASIDMLEGEGSLYIRKCETTSDNSLAYIYEYAQDVSDYKKIDSWKDYVWYVSYGSNMLYERFICYIEGGQFEGSDSYREPCDDPTPPIEKRAIDIPYDMYFGNTSKSWDFGGVSFLDTSKKGYALGVAYLITKEQFEHVAAQENRGRFPDGSSSWYENIITFGKMDGYELVTVTNDELREYNEPSEGYLNTLKRGIKENWPEMSEEEMDSYLNSCIRE